MEKRETTRLSLFPAQRGNALFLILIAVALFAALSYAVTQSGRGSGNINKEQATLTAARFVSFMNEISTAVMRMSLSGVDMSTLQLYTAPQTWASADTPCSTGTNCLFAPEGGGMAWKGKPSEQFFTPVPYTGDDADKFRFLTVGDSLALTNVGTAAEDIVLMVEGIPKDICTAINKGLGRPAADSLAQSASPEDYLQGDSEGCTRDVAAGEAGNAATGGGPYYLYLHVLVAR